MYKPTAMKIATKLKNDLIEDPGKQCVLGVVLQVCLILVIIKDIVPLILNQEMLNKASAAMSEETLYHLAACFCFGVAASTFNILTYGRKILDTIVLFICWMVFVRSFPDLAYECLCWVLPMTLVLLALERLKHVILTILGLKTNKDGNKCAD